VNAQISEGNTGGFNFSGTLTNTMGMQGPFQAGFTQGVNSYDETDCTVALGMEGFTSSGAVSTTDPSITAGRVRAMLVCPMLVQPEDNDVCHGSATFVLQNCVD